METIRTFSFSFSFSPSPVPPSRRHIRRARTLTLAFFADVPIGGAAGALEKLGAKLGIDLVHGHGENGEGSGSGARGAPATAAATPSKL